MNSLHCLHETVPLLLLNALLGAAAQYQWYCLHEADSQLLDLVTLLVETGPGCSTKPFGTLNAAVWLGSFDECAGSAACIAANAAGLMNSMGISAQGRIIVFLDGSKMICLPPEGNRGSGPAGCCDGQGFVSRVVILDFCLFGLLAVAG